MNYENVKMFGNEKMEKSNYEKLLQTLMRQADLVQTSLGTLNAGQVGIFSIGLSLNLIMAASDVTSGVMTMGDFVMI